MRPTNLSVDVHAYIPYPAKKGMALGMRPAVLIILSGSGIHSSVFSVNCSFFAKNEQMRDLLKETLDLLMVAHFW